MNPLSFPGSGSFVVQTFEVVNQTLYQIDQSNATLTVSVNCNYPCLACSKGKSTCDSCLTTLNGTQLFLQETSCVS